VARRKNYGNRSRIHPTEKSEEKTAEEARAAESKEK